MAINHVDTLYSLGDDALQNQFKIEIALPSGLSDTGKLQLRVTQVTIPAPTMGTYEVHFRSRKIAKPSGKIETSNEMSFTFRVDKNYTTYKLLSKWLNRVGNNNTGALAADDGNIRGGITVTALNPQTDNAEATWVFHGVFIKGIATVSFDHATGDPITVQPDFNFTKITGTAFGV